MQTKGIRLWSKNHALVSAPSIGRFFLPIMIEPFFLFFLFRQLCLYISDSLHLFTLFLTDSLEKCPTKSFEDVFQHVESHSYKHKNSLTKNVKYCAKERNRKCFYLPFTRHVLDDVPPEAKGQ